MEYDITDITIFFIIYGFLGFVLETVFRSIVSKKLYVSRGFLTNYFCPLYGLCAILIVAIFTLTEIIMPRLSGLIFATAASIATVTILEYITGKVLYEVFNIKLWDYSNLPYNLHSYICLDFSFAWGIAALILISVIHPLLLIVVFAAPYLSKLMFIYTSASILFINAAYNFRKLYYRSLSS